jgi:hypothetical protein
VALNNSSNPANHQKQKSTNPMKTRTLGCLFTLLLAFSLQPSAFVHAAPLGTAFTYQGRLATSGNAASGRYDFRFAAFNAATGPTQQGPTVTTNAVAVSDGYFQVTLDFGNVFPGDARWLEIGVRTNGSATDYTLLQPRQALTPVPYALYSPNAGAALNALGVAAGVVSSLSLAPGAVTTDKIAGGAVTAAKLSASGSSSGQVLMSQGSSVNWGGGAGLALPFAGAVSAGQAALSVSNSAGIGLHGTGVSAGVRGDGVTVGVQGEAAALGRGVQGMAFMGAGVYGEGTYLFATGVEGASELGKGVWGHSTNDAGVYGHSVNNSGVLGASGAADGVEGRASAPSKSGLYGVSSHPSGFGVTGRGGQAGVQGSSGPGDGVMGGAEAPGKSGVYGFTTSATGYGMFARNNSANTWVSLAAQNSGVRASCADFLAGLGDYGEGAAVYGAHATESPTFFRGGTGSYGVWAGCSQPWQKAALFIGNVEVKNLAYDTVCELGEGLDYAEGFDVREGDEAIAPGCVLSIDEDHPGQLRLSREAYDGKVAGIVAGAKGLGSGVRLGGERFDHAVALAGRVYCNVDAAHGPVRPGSLLTTSPTPGHAMVAKDPARAQGAILGKAMEALPAGKGQILVLVTLQ